MVGIGRIIIVDEIKNFPTKLEWSAAKILADFFETDVRIVPRSSGHTPDFEIGGRMWELKSPLGSGKHVIEHQFSRANKQASNLILDARRSKMVMAKFRRMAIFEFQHSKEIKRLIIIDKQRRVTEVKKGKRKEGHLEC